MHAIQFFDDETVDFGRDCLQNQIIARGHAFPSLPNILALLATVDFVRELSSGFLSNPGRPRNLLLQEYYTDE
jgi:hypothetical protein